MSKNIAELIAELDRWKRLRESIDAENDRLRARIAELEAELAIRRGSMAPPHPADDEPARYTYNVQPNAPR